MLKQLGLAAGVGILGLATAFAMGPAAQGAKGPNRYIGVGKCKNCHETKQKGYAISVWQKTKHAHAWDALATPEAKEAAAKRGVTDPQSDPKCVKCHQTAFGKPAAEIDKSFDPKAGIQCESCHGPGENHMKARMKAAFEEDEDEDPDEMKEIDDDEIIKHPTSKTCLGCHNEESPNYKPFCMKHFYAQIKHFDPRRERSKEELKALQCKCGADVKAGEPCKCGGAGCGELPEHED